MVLWRLLPATTSRARSAGDWPGLLFGLLSILGIVPCLSFMVPSLGIQPVEFTRGLVVFVTVPTALGTIGMLTELANGNTSLATMYGVITNLLGTITAPLWLHHTLASELGGGCRGLPTTPPCPLPPTRCRARCYTSTGAGCRRFD